MEPKYKVGDLVRTIPSAPFDIEGTVTAIPYASPAVYLLWGGEQLRYKVRDSISGEYFFVVESLIEPMRPNQRRRKKIPNMWRYKEGV